MNGERPGLRERVPRQGIAARARGGTFPGVAPALGGSMSPRLLALLGTLAAFGALTGVALADVGYLGILEPHFQSWGAGQVFADLAILALLACFWMVRDARARGVSAWPFVALTLVGGSFGPLLYLAVREVREARGSAVARAAAGARA
jgi:hypothetical protein